MNLHAITPPPARIWANIPGVVYPPMITPRPYNSQRLKPPPEGIARKWSNQYKGDAFKLTHNIERKIGPMLRRGMSWEAIAQKVDAGVGKSTLRRAYCAKHGLSPKTQERRELRKKLTPAELRAEKRARDNASSRRTRAKKRAAKLYNGE